MAGRSSENTLKPALPHIIPEILLHFPCPEELSEATGFQKAPALSIFQALKTDF